MLALAGLPMRCVSHKPCPIADIVYGLLCKASVPLIGFSRVSVIADIVNELRWKTSVLKFMVLEF